MKNFNQLREEVKQLSISDEEVVKKAIKEEYSCYKREAEEDMKRAEDNIKSIILKEIDYFSVYSIYTHNRRKLFCSQIATYYKELFGEDIE